MKIKFLSESLEDMIKKNKEDMKTQLETASDNEAIVDEHETMVKNAEEAEKDIAVKGDLDGAPKAEKPDDVEEPKAIKESINEDYNTRLWSDRLYDLIEEGVVDAKQTVGDLIYWCSEDDIQRYMEVNGLAEFYEDEEVDESLTEDVSDPVVGDDGQAIHVGDTVSPWNYNEFTEDELQDKKGVVTEISGNKLTISTPSGKTIGANACDVHVSANGKGQNVTEEIDNSEVDKYLNKIWSNNSSDDIVNKILTKLGNDKFFDLLVDIYGKEVEPDEVEEALTEGTPYNAEEEETFWKLAKKKLSPEEYKNLCAQFGRCEDEETNESCETKEDCEKTEGEEIMEAKDVEYGKGNLIQAELDAGIHSNSNKFLKFKLDDYPRKLRYSFIDEKGNEKNGSNVEVSVDNTDLVVHANDVNFAKEVANAYDVPVVEDDPKDLQHYGSAHTLRIKLNDEDWGDEDLA